LIIKDSDKWKKHIKDLCSTYGFKTKHNPIIYKNNGELIGGY
jgi:hypothetical protein